MQNVCAVNMVKVVPFNSEVSLNNFVELGWFKWTKFVNFSKSFEFQILFSLQKFNLARKAIKNLSIKSSESLLTEKSKLQFKLMFNWSPDVLACDVIDLFISFSTATYHKSDYEWFPFFLSRFSFSVHPLIQVCMTLNVDSVYTVINLLFFLIPRKRCLTSSLVLR